MKRGRDVRARRQAGMGWEPRELEEEHKGQNHNFKIKITLDSTLHTHTQPITAQKRVISDEVNAVQEKGESANSK